jgi:soluble lytic murein transglycosylase
MKGKAIYKISVTILLVCVIISVSVYAYDRQREVSAINKLSDTITLSGFEYGIDANLILAVIKAESRFDENAVSKKGAKGLMQIMPETAQFISEMLESQFDEDDLFNYRLNIKYGTFYLRYLTDKYEDLLCVLAAYNAGEGNVLKWLDNNERLSIESIPFQQTRIYVEKVLRYYGDYKNKYNY